MIKRINLIKLRHSKLNKSGQQEARFVSPSFQLSKNKQNSVKKKKNVSFIVSKSKEL